MIHVSGTGWEDVCSRLGDRQYVSDNGSALRGLGAMDVDHFLHGADYPHSSGKPRDTMCASCAFRAASQVHPTDFTLSELLRLCDELDDFVCHTPDLDGSNPSCSAFHRMFRGSCKSVKSGRIA